MLYVIELFVYQIELNFFDTFYRQRPFSLCKILTSTFHRSSTQPAIICSKLTIETLEQGTKYVPRSTIKTPMPSFCCLYC